MDTQTINQDATTRIRNRIGKQDDLSTTIDKMTGQRDAKSRWRYRTDEKLLNAGIVALYHLTPLNPILEQNLEAIAQLKKNKGNGKK